MIGCFLIIMARQDHGDRRFKTLNLTSAKRRTIYFIGVTTTQSSIMKIYPEWAKILGLEDTEIVGIDIPIHEKEEVYREVVAFIKEDPLSAGALVTTHKIDLYNATKDMFDYLCPFATSLGEISSISKRDGKLYGHAKDPISSGLAMEEFVPENYWRHFRGDVLIMGAGGSAISMGTYLMQDDFKGNYPSRIIITDLLKSRLDKVKDVFESLNPGGIELEFYLSSGTKENDKILSSLKPHSLIVNATGLGKDRPGSPISDNVEFPYDSLVWEINYRGDLNFMHQAKKQQMEKNLHIEDGWKYFIHGWTQVISEVFHITISDETLNTLSQVASKFR